MEYITEAGQTNRVQWENVGVILGITPRISPDGLVVMLIDASKQEIGPEAEGIPISIMAQTGDVIRSPRINVTLAQTTVSAADGQTIVLGGLLTKNKSVAHRKVPGLADIPLLGKTGRNLTHVTVTVKGDLDNPELRLKALENITDSAKGVLDTSGRAAERPLESARDELEKLLRRK